MMYIRRNWAVTHNTSWTLPHDAIEQPPPYNQPPSAPPYAQQQQQPQLQPMYVQMQPVPVNNPPGYTPPITQQQQQQKPSRAQQIKQRRDDREACCFGCGAFMFALLCLPCWCAERAALSGGGGGGGGGDCCSGCCDCSLCQCDGCCDCNCCSCDLCGCDCGYGLLSFPLAPLLSCSFALVVVVTAMAAATAATADPVAYQRKCLDFISSYIYIFMATPVCSCRRCCCSSL